LGISASGGMLGYTWGTLSYTYNNEGRVTSVTYPATTQPDRASGMTLDSTGGVLVNSVQYGPAGEMLQMQDVGTNLLNTYQYNSLRQLTRTTTKWFTNVQMDMQYTYSGTRNNGQITQSQDYVTGEQVNYTYDQLQRLIAAQTTGPQLGADVQLRRVRQPPVAGGNERDGPHGVFQLRHGQSHHELYP
jgi:hypothetical protein